MKSFYELWQLSEADQDALVGSTCIMQSRLKEEYLIVHLDEYTSGYFYNRKYCPVQFTNTSYFRKCIKPAFFMYSVDDFTLRAEYTVPDAAGYEAQQKIMNRLRDYNFRNINLSATKEYLTFLGFEWDIY